MAYDIGAAYAIRMKTKTTWSLTLKAASMGHSEQTHRNKYLRGERLEQTMEAMARQRALDEGKEWNPTPQERGREETLCSGEVG